MPVVFVIIVNYHASRLTAETVTSLQKCRNASHLRIVVVDNDSVPCALGQLRRQFPECVFLPTERNEGFGGGNNIGIRYALAHGAEWILLLNNDTEVDPDFLAPLLTAARDGRTFATPKIIYAGDRRRIWYGGGFVDFRRGGFYHETDVERAAIERDVTFASGCCLLGSAKCFRDLGGLDEDYFLYYEDAAFCLKAQAAGFRIRYVPESIIAHKVSATTGSGSKVTAYYGARNRLMVLSRFGFPRRAFAYVLATRAAYLLAAVVRPNLWHVMFGVIDWVRGRMGRRAGLDEVSFPIVVNGVFVGRQGSGLERFATETLRALDGLVAPGQFRLLVPRRADASDLPEFRNIEIVRHGCLKGWAWEQIELAWYARWRRLKVLSLTNTAPFRHADYVCIHDVFYVTHAKEFSRTLRGFLSMIWHRLHYREIAKRGRVVLTVSEYSARQISEKIGVPAARLAVLGNGWEHMKRIQADGAVFERFPCLKRGAYFFTLGNRAPYKNMRWILAAAAAHPEIQWVVTGAAMRTVRQETGTSPNVVFTGRLSDGEMKALMENCRMLVHPSLDEGFGIPPLEALSVGRPALVARAASMPEVYGEAVYWIDNPCEDDGTFAAQAQGEFKPEETQPILVRNTWENVACKLLEAIT